MAKILMVSEIKKLFLFEQQIIQIIKTNKTVNFPAKTFNHILMMMMCLHHQFSSVVSIK